MDSILNATISASHSAADLRRAIINAIFGIDLSQADYNANSEGLDTYFTEWFEDQCKRSRRQISASTYLNLLKVIAVLKHSQEDQSTMIDNIVRQGGTAGLSSLKVKATVILGARLLSMLSIGEIENCISPGRAVVWQQGSLRESIAHEFPPSKIEETEKIPKIFKAINLKKVAGIKVRWTSNLADHLSLEGDELRIFHHISILELHNRSSSQLFPSGFLEETMRTMALMIPSNDQKSVKWFRRQRDVLLDPRAATCGHLNSRDRHIENFNYWKDRIVILKQTFDESEPRSVSHWWYDDRKKVQWWTFWIAALVLLLTIVFGLTQSVTGIISAWAAVKSIPN